MRYASESLLSSIFNVNLASHFFILTSHFFVSLPLFPTWFDFSVTTVYILPILAIKSHFPLLAMTSRFPFPAFVFVTSPLFPPPTSHYNFLHLLLAYNCSPLLFNCQFLLRIPFLTFHFITSFEFALPTSRLPLSTSYL